MLEALSPVASCSSGRDADSKPRVQNTARAARATSAGSNALVRPIAGSRRSDLWNVHSSIYWSGHFTNPIGRFAPAPAHGKGSFDVDRSQHPDPARRPPLGVADPG